MSITCSLTLEIFTPHVSVEVYKQYRMSIKFELMKPEYKQRQI